MIAITDEQGVLSHLAGEVLRFPFVFEDKTDFGIGSIVFEHDYHYYLSVPNHPSHWFADPEEVEGLEGLEIVVAPAAWTTWIGTAKGHQIRLEHNGETIIDLFYSTETQK